MSMRGSLKVLTLIIAGFYLLQKYSIWIVEGMTK
jgi:hypothetical protein